MELYKPVVRYRLVADGRKVLGVDPASRRVEYLPAGGEGEKALEWFVSHLFAGFAEHLKKEG